MWVLPRAGSPTVTTRIFPAWKRSPEAVVYSGATIAIELLVSQGQVKWSVSIVHHPRLYGMITSAIKPNPILGVFQCIHLEQRAYNIILLHPEPVPQSQHMTTAYMCQRYNKKGNPEGTKHQSHVDCALGQGDMRSGTSAICTQHIIHFEGSRGPEKNKGTRARAMRPFCP